VTTRATDRAAHSWCRPDPSVAAAPGEAADAGCRTLALHRRGSRLHAVTRAPHPATNGAKPSVRREPSRRQQRVHPRCRGASAPGWRPEGATTHRPRRRRSSMCRDLRRATWHRRSHRGRLFAEKLRQAVACGLVKDHLVPVSVRAGAHVAADRPRDRVLQSSGRRLVIGMCFWHGATLGATRDLGLEHADRPSRIGCAPRQDRAAVVVGLGE
jgi:hypothetical protein